MNAENKIEYSPETAIAIVGMSGRFPNAHNVEEFWQNLVNGVISIRSFSDEELREAGVSEETLNHPDFVKAGTIMPDIDLFDAAFFGYTPREAQVMDPQHRLFLECAWQALEDAAYDTERFQGLVGVFGGSAFHYYMMNNLITHEELSEGMGKLQMAVANERDSLASTVSYKLNLKGPSLSVQTFCSTSMVAVHLGCQSLFNYECDIALAGGVAIIIPQVAGYFYEEGGILSPDGACRTFDINAQGSVMGNGLGVVALKRLNDAIENGDHIYAVIRGSAVNNDGVIKVGYTAPGLGGQSEVIAEALSVSGVDPTTIDYIEAHGTATPLGDAVELAAMIKAFTIDTDKKRFCAIGSVKPNIGHLDRASGVTGLIKTALALKNHQIPPSLNFTRTTPDIDLHNSPFYVNTTLTEWPANGKPRRAGVNSFGLGGTNVHAVLEEAPNLLPSSPSRSHQTILISAKTETALENSTTNLINYLQSNPHAKLADVAFTLQVGRSAFNHRRFVVGNSTTDVIKALSDPRRVFTQEQSQRNRPVAFMFTGVGDHYTGLGAALYVTEPTFQTYVDTCAEQLMPILGVDLRHILYPDGAKQAIPTNEAGINLRQMLRRTSAAAVKDERHKQPSIAQTLNFVIEYALTQLLIEWGITPKSLIGYSLGEYVAACVAGVMTLTDALSLVAHRGLMIDTLESGSMMAVSLSEKELAPLLPADVVISAIFGPQACILSGHTAAMETFSQQLTAKNISYQPIATTHAFHSPMMTPIVNEFTQHIQSIPLNAPQIPFLSNVTGNWITDEEATDPAYWGQHLCQCVRFSDELTHLLQDETLLLLEIGPGQSLSSFVKQHPACTHQRFQRILPTMRSAYEKQSDVAYLLNTLGKLWLAGVDIDWHEFYRHEKRHRLSLPTYPFDYQSYWIDRQGTKTKQSTQHHATLDKAPPKKETAKDPNIGNWFYQLGWETTPLPSTENKTKRPFPWLIFLDKQEIGTHISQHAAQQGLVIQVTPGDAFAQQALHHFSIRPHHADDYEALLAHLNEHNQLPKKIIHLWGLTPNQTGTSAAFTEAQTWGFYSLIHLAQALGTHAVNEQLEIIAIADHLHEVTGAEPLCPEKTTLVGVCKSIPQEYLNITCRLIDIDHIWPTETAVFTLLTEINTPSTNPIVTYRNSQRYTQTYTLAPLAPPTTPPFKHQGVYLITGGLGGIGLILATHLAQTVQARILLTTRSPFPDRAAWPAWLAEHSDDDKTTARIKKVQALEAAGSEVFVVHADAADLAQMTQAVQQATTQLGQLNGVFHTAGVSDEMAFNIIQAVQPTQCEAHFKPKAHALYVLEAALADQELDFCMLFSSLSAVLAGLGFVGYTAANIFMDAFTHQHNRTAVTPWVSINWDTWQVRPNQHDTLGGTIMAYEMTPAEGIRAVEYLLSNPVKTHLINSTGNLHTRIRQWIDLESLQPSTTKPQQLPTIARPNLPTPYTPPTTNYESALATIWQDLLGIDQVGIYDNFFDLGGNSLIGLQLVAKLKKKLKRQISVVALFEAPTISTLAKYLRADETEEADAEEQRLAMRRKQARQQAGQGAIAIISMAGKFPGATTIEAYWDNLCNGVESINTFTHEELEASGIPAELYNAPSYIRARPILEDADLFDALFFGYSPREAEFTGPQHRLFLECAWEALERAGYTGDTYSGLIGVFGGANLSTYLLDLIQDPDFIKSLSVYEATYQVVIGNDKDSLTTDTSYKLNLKGPSVAVQTFCSTSLVATHLACQSLLTGECDMAMAGGVSVRTPLKSGYIYEEGGMESPDGHCRTFDAKAGGTLFGDGVGIVVLKRLEDAIEDGDQIYAVIRGSAMNNDGSLKVSYPAPSVEGQSQVVVTALENAGVTADTIDYIEAHGTATKLGDPIEVAALTKAFRKTTNLTQYCAIGSVKPNVGHLDRAAGISGLIKTAMAIHHGEIPPHLHFEKPNPEIDFETSPFFVNTQRTKWASNGQPRRAGVNSLGMGGTNVHLVLEQAPTIIPSGATRPYQLIMLSARTPTALDTMTHNLATHLKNNPKAKLADVAYTLQLGRKRFPHRRMLQCETRGDALALLASPHSPQLFTQYEKRIDRPITFMFSGLGDQYVNMARDLYESEKPFQVEVDRCFDFLAKQYNLDLRPILYPTPTKPSQNGSHNGLATYQTLQPDHVLNGPLQETAVAQPTLFTIEYALATLLMQWGIHPQAMIGSNLGGYVAACLSGVLSLEDALTFVTEQARLIQEAPAGIPEQSALITLAQRLNFNPPHIPFIANSTGTWITAAEATDPAYWANQFHQTVPSAQTIETLLNNPEMLLLEIGPGHTLSTIIKEHPQCTPERAQQLVLSTLRDRYEQQSDLSFLLLTIGKMWLAGVDIHWHNYYQEEKRNRVILPTYPFERQRYWLAPKNRSFVAIDKQVDTQGTSSTPGITTPQDLLHDEPEKRQDITDWFFAPTWQRSVPRRWTPEKQLTKQPYNWLIFADECGLGNTLAERLRACQQRVTVVKAGTAFEQVTPDSYIIRPSQRADYTHVLTTLQRADALPDKIVHMWSVTPTQKVNELTYEMVDKTMATGFYSLLSLTQVLGNLNPEMCQIAIISSDMQDVLDNVHLRPDKAVLMGPCKVIDQEYANIETFSIDISLSHASHDKLVEQLLSELADATFVEQVIAFRNNTRWVQKYEPTPIHSERAVQRLRPQGVYLITGGLGGIGLALANYLVQEVGAKVVLLSRSGLPPRAEWPQLRHDKMIGHKINKIMALEEIGAEMLILAADVSERDQMKTAVSHILTHFGTLNGVIHAAALPPSGIIQLKEPSMATAVMAPKVKGTLILQEVLQDIPLDFMLLFSSMSAITGGGPGQIDYCGANAFLDAYARANVQKNGYTATISWGEWQWDAWEAGLEGFPTEAQAFFKARRRTFGIDFEEGFEALHRVLSYYIPHVIVATQDFKWMVAGSRRFTIAAILERVETYRQYAPKHPRPALGTNYVAPTNQVEETIADIWSNLLGIEGIGIHDNFLELGGNSLMGTRLISRLRQSFNVDLPVAIMFEAPTIAEMGIAVEIAIIDELEGLDEENVPDFV